MNQPNSFPVSKLNPFLANSVPKSGTHLLHQMLTAMPGVNHDILDQKNKFFVNNPPRNFYEDHEHRLSQLKPNQFGLGHLHFTEEYKNLLSKYKMKHIFIYRDPRDVLVSLAHFIPSKWNKHPLHHSFKSLSVKQRLLTLIRGIPGQFPHFYDYFSPYYGWLKEEDLLKVRFEELIGVSQQNRRQTTYRIASYLWKDLQPPIPLNQIALLMEKGIDSKTSRTYRKGQVGEWRKEFDPEVKAAFKKVMGSLIVDTGYEANNQW
jgi:hypothetical protein